MPDSITREYLRKRYWMATAAILVVLLVCTVVGWSLVVSLQANAQFAQAFSQLIEATHHLQSEVNRAVDDHGSNAAELHNGVHSGDEDAEAADATAHHLGVAHAFEELAVVFTAIRKSDLDGVGGGDDEENVDPDERNWDVVAHRLFADLDNEVSHFGLTTGQMPDRLMTVWEGGDERIDGGLETLIGKVLELSTTIVEAEDKNSAESREAAQALENLILNRVSLVFHDVAPIINEELTSGASLLLGILLTSAFAVMSAILFNVIVIFTPLEKAVVDSQRAITRQRDRAIAAEEAKRSFLAVMSHELRTPMNGIMGFANLLLRSGLNEKQRDYAETIYTSGDTLLSLLNDILDISKIEAGSLELEKTDFDLKDVVKSVVTLLGPRAYTNRLELSTYIDPSLPQCLNGDAGRVRQILLNLVGNAIKFTPSGAIAIEVTEEKHAGQGERDVRIAVTDTGVGIPKDKIEAIFERFVQVEDGSNRKYEGSGLGLAICKQLAALMGGQIGVESTEDQGSTFWVTIRLSDADPTSRQIADAAPAELSGRRVLVVDDNALNRRIFKLQLESHGVDVELVPDARSAMKQLPEAKINGRAFELAIIDHMMPETDGITLAKLIRAEPELRGIKLILSSSSGLTADQQARVLGFDATCPKPVHQDKVLETIQRLLSGAADEVERDAPDAQISVSSNVVEIDKNSDPTQRILIVEDNAINQRLAMTVLTTAGFTVDAVADGSEAVRAVQALPYDLILMDIRMPVMGGVEATKRIRALDLAVSDCPIIAMTANAIRGDREEYLAAGMNDYISKPIDIRGLVQKVEEYVGMVKKADDSDVASTDEPATKNWA
ncbi:response regulator [Pelagibius sp. Alg239-R121]|uniref:hybrid sensor histidine kinase/response regulator n=1 Tax=Pelagibius sp. Alg239-R121 TaxID=2993448 RepID=UPI0024A75D89|nr:response regulator [Pelagibius sp. Alg239-R121]